MGVRDSASSAVTVPDAASATSAASKAANLSASLSRMCSGVGQCPRRVAHLRRHMRHGGQDRDKAGNFLAPASPPRRGRRETSGGFRWCGCPAACASSGASGAMPSRARKRRAAGHAGAPLDHRMADKDAPSGHISRRTALRTETAPAPDRNSAPSPWRDRRALAQTCGAT